MEHAMARVGCSEFPTPEFGAAASLRGTGRGDTDVRYAGIHRYDILRDPRPVLDKPSQLGISGAVRVDGQPLPRLLARVRLLPRRGHADPDGRRAHAAAGRSPGRRQDLRNGPVRTQAPL